MKTEMTWDEYQASKRRLADMAKRLGMEKIENDGTAYTVIVFKLLERIERLEARIDSINDVLLRNAEAWSKLLARLEKLEGRGKPLSHWTDMPR